MIMERRQRRKGSKERSEEIHRWLPPRGNLCEVTHVDENGKRKAVEDDTRERLPDGQDASPDDVRGKSTAEDCLHPSTEGECRAF